MINVNNSERPTRSELLASFATTEPPELNMTPVSDSELPAPEVFAASDGNVYSRNDILLATLEQNISGRAVELTPVSMDTESSQKVKKG